MSSKRGWPKEMVVDRTNEDYIRIYALSGKMWTKRGWPKEMVVDRTNEEYI